MLEKCGICAVFIAPDVGIAIHPCPSATCP
jgi:hypothetical protein